MIMTNRLPKEYTEVEYIQNSGTQYIDTGFIPNYDKSIKIEIVTTPTVSGRRYCLMSNYNAVNHLSLELNASDRARIYWNNGQVNRTLSISLSDKNTIIFEYDTTNKQYNFIVNDGTINDNMNATGVSGKSLLIFVDQSKKFSTFSTPLKIYSIRIWEDNILIKDLIPCVRKSDNEVGMYDLANGRFLTNAGTGTFTAGNKVQVKVKKIKAKINETMKNIYYITTKVNNVMVKVFNALSVRDTGTNITLDGTANLKFIQPPLPRGNSTQATLPTGYTQLDYIESTGTQYIDTGYTPVQNDDFEFKNVTIKGNGILFYAGTGDYQLGLYVYATDTGYYKYFATGGAPVVSQPYTTNGVIKIINGTLYYGETWKAQSNYAGAVNTTLEIFRRPTGANYILAQMGEIIITNNGTIKRDFIPCKNPNNEVGYYDLVTKTFFGNSGSGTFIAGDVSTETLPNPDFEVPIQNVTGDVEVVVSNADDTETQTFTFPLGTQRLMLGDYLADDGIHHVRKQVVFNGTESWAKEIGNDGRYNLLVDNAVLGSATNNPIICNYFQSRFGLTNYSIFLSGAAHMICIVYQDIEFVLSTWKAWLAENPITVEYELTEEEITPYTTEQQTVYDEIKQAISYEEQTNISGTSDEANPIFKVEAYQRAS